MWKQTRQKSPGVGRLLDLTLKIIRFPLSSFYHLNWKAEETEHHMSPAAVASDTV